MSVNFAELLNESTYNFSNKSLDFFAKKQYFKNQSHLEKNAINSERKRDREEVFFVHHHQTLRGGNGQKAVKKNLICTPWN